MKTSKLKGKMMEYGLNQTEMSDRIGMSLSRFNAKLNETGGAEFNLGELQSIKKILGLNANEVDDIFFDV